MNPTLALLGQDPRVEAALIAAAVSVVGLLLTTFVAVPLRLAFDSRLLTKRIKSEETRERERIRSEEAIHREKLDADRRLQDAASQHERELLARKLEVEHEYEQRKELRELIGRYRGRIVEAADLYSRRMHNLYGNAVKGWTHVEGDYANMHYYFHSFTLRFLVL